MILPAQMIRARCRDQGLITPFRERTVVEGMTYGVSGHGYDVRIAETIWLWPFWGRLASTIERFEMPTDLAAFVHDKSTWARRFVFVQNTVVESGWRGFLTIELTRFLPWPVRIKAGSPIAQVIFVDLCEPTEQPYGNGKYQDQPAQPVKAKLEALEASRG